MHKKRISHIQFLAIKIVGIICLSSFLNAQAQPVYKEKANNIQTSYLESERELESLRALLGMQHWREMVEEVMRDKVRSKYPLISAQSIWNAINLSDDEKHSV